jgi:hypothetical protein
VRYLARVLVGTGLVAAIAVAVVIGTAGAHEAAKARRFDRTVWIQANEPCTKSGRGRMVDDLIARHLETGMQMSNARKLLGAPDEVNNHVWFYNVSAEDSGFLPTCIGLQLLTARGRLVRAAVTRDG